MTSHAAPAAEMMMPAAPQPMAHKASTPALSLPRGSALSDWIAPVRAWQTVAWEAATLAAAAGSGRSTPTATAAYVGAGALVGMTSLRVHGRCFAQWADTQGRYRYRRLAVRRRARAAAEAAVQPLATLLPDLGLGQYVDRAGNHVGLAASDGGWVSVVRLGPTAEPDIAALIKVLRETFAGTTIPLASAQLVAWTAAAPRQPVPSRPIQNQPPAPDPADLTATTTHQVLAPDPADLTATMDNRGARSDPADLTATAVHRVLAPDLDLTVTLPALTPDALAAIAGNGSSNAPNVQSQPATPGQNGSLSTPGQPPAPPATPDRGPMRVYWLALRYRPRQAPHAALARGGGELGAARAVASAALGLVARLDEAGYPADALDQYELGQELLVALNAGDPAPTEVQETWRDWSTGHLRQACFEPHRALDPAGLLDRWSPDAAFTCASYTLSRTPRGRIRGESAFRVAATDVAELEPPVPAVRANGRQQEFVLRTLPLAVHR